MKKEKRVVVLIQNRSGEDYYMVLESPVVLSESEALTQFRLEKDSFFRGDGYGAIPYWLDVVIDGGEVFIPISIGFESEMTQEHAAW